VYAHIIYDFIESTTKKHELPVLLLRAACKNNPRALRKIYDMKESLGSRYFNGERDIPTEIKQHYIHPGVPNMPELVEDHFKAEFENLIYEEQIDDLLNAFLSAIEADENITEEQSSNFFTLAKKDTIYKFLAETFIYAMRQKNNINKQKSEYPSSLYADTPAPKQFSEEKALSAVPSDATSSRLCSILLGFPLHKLMKRQNQQIADSVKSFAKEKFISPLFFEKKTPGAPMLKDVYTFQNFITYGLPKVSNENEHDDLEALIHKFLEEASDSRSDYFRNIGCITDELSGLIILANAGMGKSSILSWIAYNCEQLFPASAYEHVYLAKLRDLSEQVCSVDRLTELFGAVKEYIKGSIFLLDAFDEFTTNSDEDKRIEFIESLCSQIYQNGGKLIITSRLNYFEHFKPENFTYAIAIGLCPFTDKQAMQWWEKYSNKKPASFVRTNFKGIQQKIDNATDRSFYGIPLILYMVAYSGINVDEYRTNYDLYTALFGENGIRLYGARESRLRILSPNYNKYVRFKPKESRMLFDVLCDVAYQIYQNENENIANGCVLRPQVRDIIRSNYPEEYEVFLLNHYSIASYFRADSDGMLEFVHRSIFDYYLARWILREYCVHQHREAFELMRHTSNATNGFLLQAIFAEGIEDIALAGLDLSGADFTGLDVKANLKGTTLSRVIVKGGSLEDADLDESTIMEGIVTR